MSRAVPEPTVRTLFRFGVLVMVDGAPATAQLNEEPSGQTARNCTRVVGSVSSVSGCSKSRVLRTRSVPSTTAPSAQVCGTDQNASPVSSVNVSCSPATADTAVAGTTAIAATSGTSQRFLKLPDQLIMTSRGLRGRDDREDSPPHAGPAVNRRSTGLWG